MHPCQHQCQHSRAQTRVSTRVSTRARTRVSTRVCTRVSTRARTRVSTRVCSCGSTHAHTRVRSNPAVMYGSSIAGTRRPRMHCSHGPSVGQRGAHRLAIEQRAGGHPCHPLAGRHRPVLNVEVRGWCGKDRFPVLRAVRVDAAVGPGTFGPRRQKSQNRQTGGVSGTVRCQWHGTVSVARYGVSGTVRSIAMWPIRTNSSRASAPKI
jgi:hypothetical protein